MLQITIPSIEFYDETRKLFVSTKEQTLQLEHSLVSISKWESRWHKAFISNNEKTSEETVDYVKCMTLTQNVDPMVYACLNQEHFRLINEYISDSKTATVVPEDKRGRVNRDIITSELIYYWMIALNIPMECQKWHLNRLLTLIKVCNFKNQPDKKMSKRDVISRNRAINEARRKQLNSRG